MPKFFTFWGSYTKNSELLQHFINLDDVSRITADRRNFTITFIFKGENTPDAVYHAKDEVAYNNMVAKLERVTNSLV